LVDEIIREIPVKEIGHGVHKHPARSLPLEWEFEPLWPELQVEALLVWMPRNAAKPFGKGHGIAVITTRAHLSATGDRVPRGVCPFDR
jgi:hypothetical protein